MQPCRITTRVVPRVARTSTPSRTMFTSPFFPQFGGDFLPLFRAFDSAVAEMTPASPRLPSRRSFTPRFDVREIGSSYELQGELPGMDQQDLEIEFVDERTLVIRGKSIRDTTSGNAEASQTVHATEGREATDDSTSGKSANYQATVEDEYIDAGADAKESAKSSASPNVEAVNALEVTKADIEPAVKFWVNERSVGEFERRFSFPGHVDQDAVKASLKNGILSVVVPKIVEKQARRIDIL